MIKFSYRDILGKLMDLVLENVFFCLRSTEEHANTFSLARSKIRYECRFTYCLVCGPQSAVHIQEISVVTYGTRPSICVRFDGPLSKIQFLFVFELVVSITSRYFQQHEDYNCNIIIRTDFYYCLCWFVLFIYEQYRLQRLCNFM